jgi:hypothetical protein
MKKQIKLCLIFQISISSFLLQAQQKVSWDYPIKPGTEQWKAFQTHDEMLKACQIPEDIINNLKTKDLIETIFNYPLLAEVVTYNSLQKGMDKVTYNFNGFKTLFERKDALQELLYKYETMNPNSVSTFRESHKKGEYMYKMRFLELIVSQNNLKSQWDEKSSKKFIKLLLKNRDFQKSDIKTFGEWADIPMAYSVGSVLKYTNQKEIIENDKSSFKKFMETSLPKNKDDLEQIFTIASKYVN